MEWERIEYQVQCRPELDPEFVPVMAVLRAHQQHLLKQGGEPVAIAIVRPDGTTFVHEMMVHTNSNYAHTDQKLAERVVKFLLWMKGGCIIQVCGNERIGNHIKRAYCHGGERSFDVAFMERIYEEPFLVELLPYSQKPSEKEAPIEIGGHNEGCRIGFDAGGSDRKVSAVIDGQPVFSEEVVWHPKTWEDPERHYQGILSALKKAGGYLPKVDAIGISSAGIYINNQCKVASLFLKVPDALFEGKVKNIYLDAAREIGAPVKVANDGDVAALAGAMGLGTYNILGIAMGTSEAVGYVDAKGNIRGWLNELAFAPVDLSAAAMEDEWSGDIGCGVKYFSQDGVIKLAQRSGFEFAKANSPGEKLVQIQNAMQKSPQEILPIYESIGVYLGHSLALYYYFYEMHHALIMGRVMSGPGGDVILAMANKTLLADYPELAGKIQVRLPDEKTRRVGQSVAAASL